MSDTLQDPREMRKVIIRTSLGRERMDGKDSTYRISTASALVRNVLVASEHMGYSGEDTMTMLAYHALLELEQSNDRLLEMVELSPMPTMVMKP